jgi:hypothetical protein
MQIKIPVRVVRLDVPDRASLMKGFVYAHLEPTRPAELPVPGDAFLTSSLEPSEVMSTTRVLLPKDMLKLGDIVQITLTTADEL